MQHEVRDEQEEPRIPEPIVVEHAPAHADEPRAEPDEREHARERLERPQAPERDGEAASVELAEHDVVPEEAQRLVHGVDGDDRSRVRVSAARIEHPRARGGEREATIAPSIVLAIGARSAVPRGRPANTHASPSGTRTSTSSCSVPTASPAASPAHENAPSVPRSTSTRQACSATSITAAAAAWGRASCANVWKSRLVATSADARTAPRARTKRRATRYANGTARSESRSTVQRT